MGNKLEGEKRQVVLGVGATGRCGLITARGTHTHPPTMASGVLDWLRWSMTQDAWVYAKAPMSWYPSGAPRSMHPTIDDLAWAIPCAIVLSVFRAVATRCAVPCAGQHCCVMMFDTRVCDRLIYKPAAIHFLSARNKSEPVAVKKFTESAFKCTAYIVLSAQGLTIQFREKWLLDTSEYWRGWPQVLVPGMRLYYITELSLCKRACWIRTAAEPLLTVRRPSSTHCTVLRHATEGLRRNVHPSHRNDSINRRLVLRQLRTHWRDDHDRA